MKTPMERVAEAKAKITEVSVVQLSNNNSASSVIIDVREPEEYAAGCIDTAVNIPRGLLEFEINKHCSTDSELILYCKTGGRSALAAESLQELGYNKVVSLAGGYVAWDNQD